MRTRIFIAAALSLGTMAAAPALAQDRAPFTGLRIEGVVGYDSVSDGHSQDSSSSNGIVYGGAVGYDRQVGGAVLGIEGELTGATTDTRTDNLLTAGDRLRVDAGRDAYAGLRAGYVLSPSTMVYAKAGYTNARIETRYDAGTARVEDHADLDGYRVGAGLEQALGASTFVKGEYRYSNYGDANRYGIDAHRHQLVAGVGMRF